MLPPGYAHVYREGNLGRNCFEIFSEIGKSLKVIKTLEISPLPVKLKPKGKEEYQKVIARSFLKEDWKVLLNVLKRNKCAAVRTR